MLHFQVDVDHWKSFGRSLVQCLTVQPQLKTYPHNINPLAFFLLNYDSSGSKNAQNSINAGFNLKPLHKGFNFLDVRC